MADVLLGRLAAGAFADLATLCEPDVTFRALLPDGCYEWHGPDSVVAAFLRWFGNVDEYALVQAHVGNLGPRLHLRWRARVHGGSYGDATYVAEQHVYADPGPTGRVQALSMLCSGFAEERGHE
jgi:hypothetical protein